MKPHKPTDPPGEVDPWDELPPEKTQISAPMSIEQAQEVVAQAQRAQAQGAQRVAAPRARAPEPQAQRASATDGTAPMLRAMSSPPAAAPEPQRAPVRRGGDVVSIQQKKLSALKSLSLPKDGSRGDSREREYRGSGGGSKLPWVLLVLVLGGVAGYHFYGDRLFKKGGGPTSGGSGESGGAVEGAPAEVRAEAVHAAGGGQSLRASGYMAARIPIQVGVGTPGRLKDVVVTEGQKVKKNQIVAYLDSGGAQADMSLATAKLRAAERTLSRMRKLAAAQAATPLDLDNAVNAADIARHEIAPISQRIEQSRVRSPIDGTVLEVVAHPGESIVGNAAVVKMADLTKLVAEVDVNEADLSMVRIGQPADVVSETFPDRKFAGEVREIAEQADRARGTVQVKVHLQVPDGTLRPGMSVKVDFQSSGEKRLLVPKGALVRGGVWLVDGGQAVFRKVDSQVAGPTSIEVKSGLKDGDRVVVTGADKVHEGQTIP